MNNKIGYSGRHTKSQELRAIKEYLPEWSAIDSLWGQTSRKKTSYG
jgi:hypothetical protein